MISDDVVLEPDVVIHQPDLVNLYGCTIRAGTKIGAFVEIQKQSEIGRSCKISSHTFICSGVTVDDDVFVGHGVMFINDRFPRATGNDGKLKSQNDWECEPTLIKRRASIGSNATILSGITIGEEAVIGCGSVVTRDVPDRAVVAGNPARFLRYIE